MARDYTKAKKSKTTVAWFEAQIRLSREQVNKHRERYLSDELEKITSDHDFGDLMVANEMIAQKYKPDQVNVNLMHRWLQKLRAHAADEDIRVRFPRDWVETSEVMDVIDRAVMAEAGRMGLPQLYAEGVGDWGCIGSMWTWLEIPNLPSREDVIQGSKGADEIMAEARAGVHEPSPFQDNERLSEVLSGAASSDPLRVAAEAASSDLGAAPFELATEAAAQHAELEEEEEAHPLRWRHEEFMLTAMRVRLGESFFLDPTVTEFRDARWVARMILMPVDEAHRHPMFRPGIRTKLKGTVTGATDIWQSERDAKMSRYAAPSDKAGDEDALVCVFHILDKKWGTQHFIAEGCDEFLERDEAFPYVDENGRPLIRPLGRHPGFFPVYPCRPITTTRCDIHSVFGIPGLRMGLESQKSYIKMLSRFLEVVKKSASAKYLAKGAWPENGLDCLESPEDGVLASDDPNATVEAIRWQPASADLYQQINDEVTRFSIATGMSMTELTSRATADTATQEQMAQGGSNLLVFELIRKMEEAYAAEAYGILQMMTLYPPPVLESILGQRDADLFLKVMKEIGVPHKAPEVTISAKAREAGDLFVRIKQLMDFHERVRMDLDPMTGLPRKDSGFVLDEAAMLLNVGKLPDYQIPPEMEQAIFAEKARMMLGGGEGGPQGGGGRTEGEAARDKRQRRGEAGRAERPADRGELISAARDAGPA